jgi:hypothetical protein
MFALLLSAAAEQNLPVGSEVPLQEYIMCLADLSPEQREEVLRSGPQDRVRIADQKIVSCSEIRSKSVSKMLEIASSAQGFENEKERVRIISVYFNGLDCQFRKMAASLDVENGAQPYMGCYEAGKN